MTTVGSSDDWRSRMAFIEAATDAGGGHARQARHTRLGRLGARERIRLLLDTDSFVELGRHARHRFAHRSDLLAANRPYGDGLVCGFGSIRGRKVTVYAHEPTVLNGALGLAGSEKLCRLLDFADDRKLPVLSLIDSDGVRVDEGTFAIQSYGNVIRRTVRLKGRVPQLTLVSGLCVGAAAYNAVLTDVVGMIRGQSYMFVTGPTITRAVTGEDVGIAALGDAELHATKTGSAHAVLDDEQAGLEWLRAVLAYFSPVAPTQDSPTRLVPEIERDVMGEPRRGYEVRKVLRAVLDEGSLEELSPRWASNLVTALARLDGRSVAVLASQPSVRAGCLDVQSSLKGARLVRMASAFGMPVLTFADVPGYLPGLAQESGGLLAFGSELLSAFGSCATPQISIVLRKSYGGANVLSYCADYRIALPMANVAPIGAAAAAELSMATAVVPTTPDALERHAALRDHEMEDSTRRIGDVWTAAEEGYFDQVVAPEHLRTALCKVLSRIER
jgi:acetyl-CoA carboxylase carboxyltransferase component